LSIFDTTSNNLGNNHAEGVKTSQNGSDLHVLILVTNRTVF